jgi:hypothetical protein
MLVVLAATSQPSKAPSGAAAQAATRAEEGQAWVFEAMGGAVVETAGPDRTADFEIDLGRIESINRRQEASMDERGIDLSFEAGAAGAGARELVRHRTAVVPVDAEAWERMSPVKILQRMAREEASSGTVSMDLQKLPLSYLVKTKQGNAGVIRLRRIVEPDRKGQDGYWVEYKMVASATSPSAVTATKPTTAAVLEK